MITENAMNSKDCHTTGVTRLNWAAIFAGALVAVGLSFLLDIFGVAIGLSAYSSTSNGATALAVGGILGILIGVLVAMGTAGFVAGYLSRFYHCYCHGGILYGFLTWSVALILSALLIIPVGHYVSLYEDSLYPAATAMEMGVANAPSANANTTQVSAAGDQNATANAKNLACSSWILFVLFFLGAIASCLGACCGMKCRKEEINHRNSMHDADIRN